MVLFRPDIQSQGSVNAPTTHYAGVNPGLPLSHPGVGGEVVAVHGGQLQQGLLYLQLAPALHKALHE